MVYRITFKKSVYKDLKRISKKAAKRILDKIDNELSCSAENQPSLKGKFKRMKKFRIGEYRVIYVILNDDEVLILKIAHRKETYNK